MVATTHWEFPRPVASTKALIGLAAEYGLSSHQCLDGSTIDPQWLEDPMGTVTPVQELQVIRNALRHLGTDLPLGLELGIRHRPTTYGIWGFAVLSSSTFASAVSVGLRYMQLTSTYCRIRPSATATEALLTLDDADIPADVRDFIVENTLAALVTLQFDLDRDNLPVRALRLKRARPAYADRFQALFDAIPAFEQPENTIAIDAHRLHLKLPQGNPLTQQYCVQECQRLLRQRRMSTGLAGRVRDHIARNPTQIPTMPVLAEAFGLHPRTLRRRLADEAVDYESLADEVRGALAGELLKATDLSMEEISERLGYSEPSAFTRAFKRWKNMPPSAYRQLLQSQ